MKKSIFADVSLRETRELVGELRPDDGIDPREVAKRRRKERKVGRAGLGHGVHKQEQFLSQVQMAVETALQTATNPTLNSLAVQDVAEQGGSLVVVVTPQPGGETLDVQEASRAIEQAASMLRREVAAAITRKETPMLSSPLR